MEAVRPVKNIHVHTHTHTAYDKHITSPALHLICHMSFSRSFRAQKDLARPSPKLPFNSSSNSHTRNDSSVPVSLKDLLCSCLSGFLVASVPDPDKTACRKVQYKNNYNIFVRTSYYLLVFPFSRLASAGHPKVTVCHTKAEFFRMHGLFFSIALTHNWAWSNTDADAKITRNYITAS